MNIHYELILELLNELVKEDLNKTLVIKTGFDPGAKYIEFRKSIYGGDGIHIKFLHTSIDIYISRESIIKYQWNDITNANGNIEIANPDWKQETIKMIKSHIVPKHMCGLSGYNPMLGDICPACEYDRNKAKV